MESKQWCLFYNAFKHTIKCTTVKSIMFVPSRFLHPRAKCGIGRLIQCLCNFSFYSVGDNYATALCVSVCLLLYAAHFYETDNALTYQCSDWKNKMIYVCDHSTSSFKTYILLQGEITDPRSCDVAALITFAIWPVTGDYKNHPCPARQIMHPPCYPELYTVNIIVYRHSHWI